MCKENKCIITLIISIILGIIIGVLFYTGTILVADLILTPLIIATIFSVITLILLFITVAFAIKKETKECIGKYGNCLIAGGIGTFIFGSLGLTVLSSLVAGNILASILIGLGGLFFIFDILNFIGLLICLIKGTFIKDKKYLKFDTECNCEKC